MTEKELKAIAKRLEEKINCADYEPIKCKAEVIMGGIEVRPINDKTSIHCLEKVVACANWYGLCCFAMYQDNQIFIRLF